ncbi:spondin domain-containing protein [Seonamhaeicola sp. NFXS20]|uniref:T9SS type A sorting domain-containing protein n=1 Tax=Seonamhaeicola sp. NFXS20 TaxID=2816959 RepID=UPI003B8D7718
MKKNTFFLIFSILSFNFLFSQSIATYDIVFESIWDSATNDPVNGCSTINLPSNAHWSSLVGATHATNNTFLEIGQMATAGIESVAETGAYNIFQTEVSSNLDANQFINAGGLNTAKGTITISNLQVNENYPLLTLISMIAPTPDWFITLNSFNLRNGDTWVTSASIDLFPYNAGTEEGSEYSTTNPDTTPKNIISSLINTTPFNDKKIGTITITLNSVLNNVEFNLNDIEIYPNPAKDNIAIATPKHIELKTVEIYNVIGTLNKNIIIRENKLPLKIDVSNLNTGIYLVKLNTKNNKSLTKKLIIN